MFGGPLALIIIVGLLFYYLNGKLATRVRRRRVLLSTAALSLVNGFNSGCVGSRS